MAALIRKQNNSFDKSSCDDVGLVDLTVVTHFWFLCDTVLNVFSPNT